MKIVNARIDMRLIHGQVATMWSRMLSPDRIMVIDDEIINNNLEKSMLKMACPTGIKLSILDCETAGKNLLSGKYGDEKIFIVAKSPEIYLGLYNHGYKIPHITVANMGKRPGTKVIYKTVAATPAEEQAFRKLSNEGVKFEYRLAPRDTSMDFIKMMDDLR